LTQTDVAPLADSEARRGPFADAIDGQNSGLLKRGTEKRTGRMRFDAASPRAKINPVLGKLVVVLLPRKALFFGSSDELAVTERAAAASWM